MEISCQRDLVMAGNPRKHNWDGINCRRFGSNSIPLTSCTVPPGRNALRPAHAINEGKKVLIAPGKLVSCAYGWMEGHLLNSLAVLLTSASDLVVDWFNNTLGSNSERRRNFLMMQWSVLDHIWQSICLPLLEMLITSVCAINMQIQEGLLEGDVGLRKKS